MEGVADLASVAADIASKKRDVEACVGDDDKDDDADDGADDAAANGTTTDTNATTTNGGGRGGGGGDNPMDVDAPPHPTAASCSSSPASVPLGLILDAPSAPAPDAAEGGPDTATLDDIKASLRAMGFD